MVNTFVNCDFWKKICFSSVWIVWFFVFSLYQCSCICLYNLWALQRLISQWDFHCKYWPKSSCQSHPRYKIFSEFSFSFYRNSTYLNKSMYLPAPIFQSSYTSWSIYLSPSYLNPYDSIQLGSNTYTPSI